MLFVYIGVASVVIALLLLFRLERFASQKGMKTDLAVELRELLIARAEGRIDQNEFDTKQALLHAAVLQSPSEVKEQNRPSYWRWLLPAVVSVLVAGGIYWAISSKVSQPTSVTEDFAKLPAAKPGNQANAGGDLNTVVKKLADKMAKDPNNGEGWLLLAKTYSELKKFAEADSAYEKASPLVALDVNALTDWADAHVMANDRKWDAEGGKIVKRALAADPKHVKALALAGSEAFDRADYKQAIEFWKRMKAAAAVDSMDSKLADANIAEANSMLTGKKPVAVGNTGVAKSAVAGVVTISPKLKGQVSASDTVFVVAKAPDGNGPPLAVGRFKAMDFPIEFRLDDSSAIMPSRTISQFSDVLVSAKISKGGTAESAKGDIFAGPIKAKLGNTTLSLELNTVR